MTKPFKIFVLVDPSEMELISMSISAKRYLRMNCRILKPNKRMQTDVAYGHAADARR